MTSMDAAAKNTPVPQTRDPSKHIVDVLIEERAPHLSNGPLWPLLRPILYTVLNYKKAVYMALLARSMLNNAACIHCTAEFELAQAKKHFDSSRVRGEVIPLVFDLSGFRNAPGAAIARAKFNLPDDGVL